MIFADIRTAVTLTGEVRQARKSGGQVQISVARPPQGHGATAWGMTPESTYIYNLPTVYAVSKAFAALDEPTRRALAFSPQPGTVMERAQFWRELLRPVLLPWEYHITITALLQGFAWSIKRRTARTERGTEA